MENNLATARYFLAEGIANANLAAFDQALDPALTVRTSLHPTRPLAGREAYQQFFTEFAAAWPVIDFVLHEVWGTGDHVAARFTASVVFAHDYHGVAATRQVVPMEQVYLLTFNEGRITDIVTSSLNPLVESFLASAPPSAALAALPVVEAEGRTAELKIGIVGTGQIGGNLARLFAQAGHEVFISFSRDPQKLQALAQELGPHVQAVTPAEAVQAADVLILALHFTALDEAIGQMGNPAGKIVIDTSNPYDIVLPAGVTAMQEMQRRLPHARVVKAFNTLRAADLLTESTNGQAVVMPISGSAQAAGTVVAPLVARLGFHPLVLGDVSRVAWQEPGGPLYGRPLTRAQAEALLED